MALMKMPCAVGTGSGTLDEITIKENGLAGSNSKTFSLKKGRKVYITNTSQSVTYEFSVSGTNVNVTIAGHWDSTRLIHEVEFEVTDDTDNATVTWAQNNTSLITVVLSQA